VRPAQDLQDHLVRCGLVNCRSHGKAYPILRETRMPAVVVEPGFITNPDEAKMLSASRSAEPIVVAMVRAVGTYFGVPGS